MKKKMLTVVAHPDDEAFGPGGTLAKYAHEGVDICLLVATRGESGQFDEELKLKLERNAEKKVKLWEVREQEVIRSAKILGIDCIEFLNYRDGELRNNIYHELADKIIKKINDYKPQVVLTNERRGVSGHLDHIAVSMITTYAFQKTDIPKKLYYNCLPKKVTDIWNRDYFVYFPEGYDEDEITTRIDYSSYWETKVKAMHQHQSQMHDVRNILDRYKKHNLEKTDYFILQMHRDITISHPEGDLFMGL